MIQPVSLWNGTNSSPSITTFCFKALQGQTSPRGIPPKDDLLGGQIEARPWMRDPHRDATGTRRVLPSMIDSLSKKSGGREAEKGGEAVRKRTDQSPGPTLRSKELGVFLEGRAQIAQKGRAPFNPNHRIGCINLHGCCCSFCSDSRKPLR